MKTYDDPELQAIAVKLASDDPGIRRVGVLDLVDSGEPEAVELLLLALRDSDTSVRQEAAKVVDEFEAEDMADALIAALGDSDEVVRNAAAHALADLKDPAVAEPLLQALEDSTDGFVVAGILRALKPLRHPGSQRPALARLGDESAVVRREAVGVIGWLKQPENLPALVETAQHDADPEVRRAATGALVYATPNQVGQALIGLLKDEHWQVRCEAANSIGKLDYQDAVPALMESTRDELWQVREKSVDALGKLGSVDAIPVLGECAKDAMSNLRKAAIGALGTIAHSDGRPFVVTALDDPDPDVRKLARWAMSKLDAAA
ncbi:HEAT repeat domain-containing protein [Marinobacter salinexigens]|uniref:HEAT repeat domain-containing protein n=1 Tax=Marinobacter salinexigens TaxID=2919747 RepID=A0A5B0VDR5_9GAMM|nr:HEAT repeat domain-containing protein [Marinobacter salinexigens]KAA1172846.1 HEAT repeat domain-containing protein [Marinobacter salinexigens]